MAGNLKQVVGYVNNPDIREKAIESVTRLISPETRVVLGHSLGSVVAYEALHRKPENVHTFVTFGSPLGIRNLIFDRLRPAGPSALEPVSGRARCGGGRTLPIAETLWRIPSNSMDCSAMMSATFW